MADRGSAEKALFGVSVVLMIITSLIMNFLVCFVVYRDRLLRHQFSSVFIVNLAICDLLMALLAMPFSFGALVYSSWPFGGVACHLSGFANLILGISAILTLAMISVDRFYAVIKPLKYRAKMTMQKALCSIVCVWIQAMIFSIVPAVCRWYVFNERYLFCTFNSVFRHKTEIGFTSFLYLINFGFPLVVMLVAYYKIFKIARRHSQRIAPAVFSLGTFGMVNFVSLRKETGRQREAKAARKILVVIAAFLCCNAPYTIIRLLELTKSSNLNLPYSVTIAAKWVNFLKSSLNPMIYGLLQRRFRNALSSIFWSKCREKNPRQSFHHLSSQSRKTDLQCVNNGPLTPTTPGSNSRKFWFY